MSLKTDFSKSSNSTRILRKVIQTLRYPGYLGRKCNFKRLKERYMCIWDLRNVVEAYLYHWVTNGYRIGKDWA